MAHSIVCSWGLWLLPQLTEWKYPQTYYGEYIVMAKKQTQPSCRNAFGKKFGTFTALNGVNLDLSGWSSRFAWWCGAGKSALIRPIRCSETNIRFYFGWGQKCTLNRIVIHLKLALERFTRIWHWILCRLSRFLLGRELTFGRGPFGILNGWDGRIALRDGENRD